MRKITLNPRIADSTSFDWNNDWIVIKENDQLNEFSAPRKDNPYRGYTKEQLEVIQTVNRVLEHNNQPTMTIEEVENLLFPFGKDRKIEAEDLQALAGFKVEKKIIALDEE